MKRCPFIYLIILYSTFSIPSFGTNVFQNPQLPLDITSSIVFFYDSTGTKQITNVQKLSNSYWQPLPSPVWFGTQKGIFWLKFTIHNTTEIPVYVTFPYPFINKIDLYTGYGTAPIHQSGGFTRPFCSRSLPLHLHNFKAPASLMPQQVWVRLENNFPIIPVVQLAAEEYLYQSETKFTLIQGIYVGIMLALFLYNLILYMNIREAVYGYYLLYLVTVFMISFHHSGLTCQYIWPCDRWLWAEAIVNFAVGPSVILFANSFLRVKENAPWMYRIFLGILMIYFAYFILFLVPEYNVWINSVLEICHSLVPFLLFGVSVYIYWKKKFLSARFYILGWTIFLVSSIILFRIYGGQVDFDPISFHAIEFGSASEALLFSFALADRIRVMNREKRKNEKKQMQLEKMSYQAELTALKAQMNPHFVFNSLSSLQSLIIKDKKEQAMSYLNDFAKLTRQTLDNAT
ncbi:MAG: histidine kinase, partial [Cytophagales bacterium]|nr:histidine kinase [Cytophagales bacterium]